MRRILTIILIIYCTGNTYVFSQVHTTKGKEFWIAYMENLTLSMNGPPSFSVVVCSEVNTSGQLQIPYTGFSMPFTVTAMNCTEIYLPAGILYPQGDENIIHLGIRLVADDSVTVYAYHHRAYFTEASIIFPVSELTSSYMVTAHQDDRGWSPSEFVVEATEDSTTVKIIPSCVTASFRPEGVPFYETLNKGDVFQLQSYYNLGGTTVTALDNSKKLAIFSGARQAWIGCFQAADDHLYDQDYMAMFGTEFVVIPTYKIYTNLGDKFNILTLEDSNYISINNKTPFLLASSGQSADTVLDTASYITSTRPVRVAEYKKSSTCSGLGDPNMAIIPPISLWQYRSLFKDDSLEGADIKFYVNIVIPNTTEASSVTLDDTIISGFNALAANPMYLWKQLRVTVGIHNLYSPTGFNAITYGFGTFDSYSYNLGFNTNSNITGIKETKRIDALNIYPNPATTELLLEKQGSRMESIEVFSAPGELLFKQKANANILSINVSSLSAGIYFVRVLDVDGNILNKKIIKQ